MSNDAMSVFVSRDEWEAMKIENAKLENRIESLIMAGQVLVSRAYPMLDGTEDLELWREVSLTVKGSSLSLEDARAALGKAGE